MDEKNNVAKNLGDALKHLEDALGDLPARSTTKYPIQVSGIDFNVDPPITGKSWQSGKTPPGTFVAVRSCKKEHDDKTHLGILIGWVPIHTGVEYSKETQRLTFNHTGGNPAIFVFDYNEVVLGVECWWGPIEDEAHLREITDGDIKNVWYVKALEAMSGKP